MKKIFLAMTVVMFSIAAIADVVELLVTENGFEPKSIHAGPGKEVTLKITRKTDSTCAREIQIPSMKIKKELPLNKSILIDLGKLKKGDIDFGCGMNMMEAGRILVK